MRAWAAAMLAAGCLALGATTAGARDRDELVIGVTQFPSTFHPAIDAMMAKSYVLGLVRRPFTVHDKDWNLVCMLCERLPTIENGAAVPERTPDGRRGIAVTYAIREGARWGDGAPITTRDVVFTWEAGRHPLSGVANTELYRSIRQIDAVDERTFTLHFDRLGFDYNAINDFAPLPAHIEETRFRADPATYRNRTAFDTDTTNEGLYNGPYLVARVVAGSHVVLEPNPVWRGDPPHFRRVVVRVIENTAALEANLLSGEIDMIAGEAGLSLDQALALEKRHGRRFRVVTRPGLVFEHVDLNLANPILADVRVRRALSLAIDREAISRQLFDGRQPPAHGFVSPLDWMFADDSPRDAHDPQAAARLLAEAGWSRIVQGLRQDAAGRPLRLEFATTAGNRTRELVQQVLQSQWRRIGIDARIRNQPARVLFGETLSQRRFDAALYAWISAPENVPRTILHSAHIPAPANNYAGQNATGYANPEVDGLIDRLEVELDRERRRAMWRRLQDIYATDLPSIPLYFRADAFVLPEWLEGVEPTGHQYPTTLWVEHWRPRR